jgi:hypothetical protein
VSASTSLLRSYAQRERKIVLYIISLSRSEIKNFVRPERRPAGPKSNGPVLRERFDFAVRSYAQRERK